MVGPSSSHTAGAVRIGRIARQLFGNQSPKRADITFYGSFAETYQGHGTDLAIVAGLLGYDTDDLRIPQSIADAESQGMDIRFKVSKKAVNHPNTAGLVLESGEKRLKVVGSSIGGGNVEMLSIDDFDIKFNGSSPTLVIYHQDRPGLIADVTERLRLEQANIGRMDVDRKGRNKEAMTVIELDGPVSQAFILEVRKIAGIQDVRALGLA